MCGIFGRYRAPSLAEDPAPLQRGVALLRHRGPDDGAWWSHGPFFLGHRRLSIIDLAGGGQPMASGDGSLVVVFNGEIYNHTLLRERLTALGHRFLTRSDTEVLLHGYRQWGMELPVHLEGMFAFALADRREGSLFLARDRFGEKPLYYTFRDGAFTFASEIAPLTAQPDLPLAIDPVALGEYLCLNYVPGERTLMEGVRRLPPAFRLHLSPAGMRLERYWSPPFPPPASPLSFPDAMISLRQHLDTAVAQALCSDVPVTLFLSGGIDSSLLAESAVRQGGLRHAYCLEIPGERYSEVPQAQWVARRLGLELRVASIPPQVLNALPDIVDHADDPLADASSLAVWTLAQATAQEYKVTLAGDGGDELFGGYLTYQATRLHARWIARLPGSVRRLLAKSAGWMPVNGRHKVSFTYKLMRFLRAAHLPSQEAHFTWNGSWMPEQAACLLLDADQARLALGALGRITGRDDLPAEHPIRFLMGCDLENYLPNDILTKVDRMTMAHGLESRAPFLHRPLAEFALQQPDDFRVSGRGPPKRLLRALAREALGPRVADAPKQGFSLPLHLWLRHEGRDLLLDLLSPASLRRSGLLREKEVIALRDAHLNGQIQAGFELWGLLTLVTWLKLRLEQRPIPISPEPLPRREFPLD